MEESGLPPKGPSDQVSSLARHPGRHFMVEGGGIELCAAEGDVKFMGGGGAMISLVKFI